MCSFHIWKINFKKNRDSFYEYDDKPSGNVEGECYGTLGTDTVSL